MHLDVTLDAETQEMYGNIANSRFCVVVGPTRYTAGQIYRLLALRRISI